MDKRYRRPWLWVSALIVAVAIAGSVWFQKAGAKPQPSTSQSDSTLSDRVSCLGRIEPGEGVIHVAGAFLNEPHPSVVETLHVKVGDHVHTGELLATFVTRTQLASALDESKAETEVARRRLEQVEAGANQPDLEAQQSEIARLNANLDNARTELKRYELLKKTDDVTASELDARRTAVQQAEDAVQEANHRLESLRAASPSSIHVAEAELQAASLNQRRSQREYEMTAVRAPIDGQILKIHAYPGEEVGSDGLLDIGQTDRMYVVAEVYETDIPRVHVGEHAVISGDLLTTPISGTVERIDSAVRKSSVLPGDPASFSDNRIVEARIRVDQNDAVAKLINGKVTVVIQP